jgi:hypothetical protein
MMSNPQQQHWKPLIHLFKYVMGTPNRGLTLTPNRIWNGDMNFELPIAGRSDSDYAANTNDRRSISGSSVFIEGAPACFRRATQKFVTLSVTESESGAGVSTAQDMMMMYCYRIITPLGVKVELPMVLEVDNKGGAVDLANNYSVGRRTRHVDVKFFFPIELKEQGLLVIKHVPGSKNDADIFTKNVTA